jgi:uncharacterized protein (DUF362 family)/Pyruvate/2-oxoacid:ferredoxin oxidoreductase delta subunit
MIDKVNKVSIVKCRDYDKEALVEAIKKSVNILGGFQKLLNPKSKILIKPNLLLAAEPDRAITTHPLFVEAVIESITAITGNSKNITIADSSGPVENYDRKGIEKVYRVTGMIDVAEKTGCRLNYSTEYKILSNEKGRVLKRLEVIKPVTEADVIINLPKFKTHNLVVFTGAVKNMFGIIPGFTKVGYHLRFEDFKSFTEMLLDIIFLIKPALNIMDGITGIEGEGPGRSGTVRDIGLVLASEDPVSMDVIMSKIMNIKNDLNPMLKVLNGRGIKLYDDRSIKVLGEELSSVTIHDFRLPENINRDKIITNKFINTYVTPLIRNLLNPYMYVDHEKCNLCMTCCEICPRNSISVVDDKIKFDHKSCIRCFCCSEMCPQGAIGIRYTHLGSFILNRIKKSGQTGKKSF